MYRFFVNKDQIGPDCITITGQDVNHIKNVLRMGIGETVLVSDGEDREYACVICDMEQDSIIAKIENVSGIGRELNVQVTLFQALPKSDKMELIIQKMVELGVHEIVPIETNRCIVKYSPDKVKKKTQRYQAIALSAAKQSKRGMIPKIFRPFSMEEAVRYAKEMDMVFIPYENATDMSYTRKKIGEIKKGMRVGVFIGPEGGFTPEEVARVTNVGGYEITLGRRILRTETAGIMLMSVLMYQSEE